ncbi:Hint domain-containing protein [Yoonia maritima]|uniref:Hint domain-containing protein n=1 Tax=Yoonia maritima TaxID=1435347 RepID=UPI000D108543|nr:Hint domain-containing protein [Yoonia maritima]
MNPSLNNGADPTIGTSNTEALRRGRYATSNIPTRKYEISYLLPNGDIAEMSRVAPALPAFENAFGALGRGAMVVTSNGPMTIEDLLPGDRVRLANGNFETLLWRGAMLIQPDDLNTNSENNCLTRITAESLGPSRPSPDLILGPTAHILHRATGVRTLTGKRAAFIPVRDFIDGSQFIELRPAQPVNVFQLGFSRQESILVNGIEIESMHPGTFFALGLRGEMLVQYLSLFPHKIDLDDFGEMRNPRLRLRDLELLE